MKRIISALIFTIFFSAIFPLLGQGNKGGDFFPTSTPEAEGVASAGTLSFLERAEKETFSFWSTKTRTINWAQIGF